MERWCDAGRAQALLKVDAARLLLTAYRTNPDDKDPSMSRNDRDWISETLSLLDRLIGAATYSRAAAALTFALCSALTTSWMAIPMFTIGMTLLVCALVKRLE